MHRRFDRGFDVRFPIDDLRVAMILIGLAGSRESKMMALGRAVALELARHGILQFVADHGDGLECESIEPPGYRDRRGCDDGLMIIRQNGDYTGHELVWMTNVLRWQQIDQFTPRLGCEDLAIRQWHQPRHRIL